MGQALDRIKENRSELMSLVHDSVADHLQLIRHWGAIIRKAEEVGQSEEFRNILKGTAVHGCFRSAS